MSRINEAAAEGLPASMLTRRAALSFIPLAASLYPPTAEGAAVTPIASLFQQWQAENENAFPDVADEDAYQAYERYRHLQEAIGQENPVTAGDVARQFLAETDDGASEYRDVFLERMQALAREA